MRQKSITRWQWAKISLLFGFFYTLTAYLISTPYLGFIHAPSSLGKGYLTLAYVGQIGLLGLLGALLATLITPIIKQRHINYLVLWLIGSATLVLLYTDTRIYELYRFHLGGFVWSLVFGEGASQVVEVSWYTMAISALMITLLATTTALAVWLSIRCTLRNQLGGARWFYTLSVLISLLSANALHVWYDAHGNAEIRAMTRHLPLYQPATAIRFMAEQGWIDPHTVSERPSLHNVAGSELNYPTQGFETHTEKNKPNILFVTVDAWRGDSFDAETTPFTYSLINQPNALYFTDHQSGGNVTKGGIFSLFYALPPTYWDAFTAAQRPPVFFDTLLEAGYQTGIFGSGPLINPSFHRNVFSSIPNLKTKTEGETPYLRDKKMVSNLVNFLQSDSEPFVSFVFFDAAHGYAPPPDFEPKFQPYWDRVDHVDLGPDFDPVPYKNRYRTALRFVDDQIKTIYKTLEDTGKLEDTIVIFTSDHGEEFNETKMNYWGHGSNFTQNQTHVPLLILWPGKTAQQMDYRTSHYDITPTLLQDALGVDVPIHQYSSGRSLFDATPREWLLVHSYFNYGVLMDDRIITTFPTGQFEVTDLDLQPTNKTMPAKITLEVLQEISRFYQ